MTDKDKEMINLGDFKLYGVSTDEMGAPLPVNCPKCKRKLTVLYLNDRCTIDVEIECSNCGEKMKGTDLRAELQGKVSLR